jgi:3-hydroxyisobutyrate dehydrogenase-like beta-hydroxyacid dehydrogenase
MDIGFIGLGNMGKPMALNLLNSGHRLRVWNRSPAPAQELGARGAIVASSPGEAFQGGAVISILSDDETVRHIIVEQALAAAAKPAVHVNMATISIACARELTRLHAQKGIGYIAAPVLGRPEVAAAGKLEIMAAGAAEMLDRLAPLFAAIGQRVWRFGDEPSRANAVKIAINFTLACAIEAMAEGAALVQAHGIERGGFLDLLTSSIFNTPVYKGYAGLIAERQYEPPKFKLTLGFKDVSLALQAGEDGKVPLPFGSILRDNFIDAIAHGYGGKDWSAVAEVAVRRASLSPSLSGISSQA